MALSRALMPTMQQLTAFEAACRYGSFTKAAEELALTQSAVSKQVRQLEDTLGVALFSRSNGRVAMTVLGAQYRRRVRQILLDYETATHAVVASGGSAASLRVAVLPTFGSRWLVPRLPGFLAGRPNVAMHMSSETEPFDLVEKAVDVAIHYGDDNWPQADATFLFDEVILAVSSPEYLAAHGIREASDLRAATLLQQATRPNLWQDWFDAAGAVHPFPLRGPIFDQFSMISQAAAAGMGVALIPTFLIERELQSGALAPLAEAPLPGAGAYYAVAPVTQRRDPLIAGFIDWLVSEARTSHDLSAIRRI